MTVDERRRAAELEEHGFICTQPDRLRDGEHSTQHSIQHIRQKHYSHNWYGYGYRHAAAYSVLYSRVLVRRECAGSADFSLFTGNKNENALRIIVLIIDMFIFYFYLATLLLSSVVVRSVRIEAR